MTSKYLEQHRRWWAQTLGNDLAEARIVIPKEQYAKIVRIATDLEERIPIVLGKLIVDYFEAVESGQLKMTPLAPKATSKMPDQSQLERLCQLLSWSRFPDDTGANRFRQIALITTLAHEHAQRRKPTASSVGRIIDSHVSQIDLMARVLEERGVIERVHTPNIRPGVSGKVLYLNPDAADALDKSHVRATGSSISPVLEPE